MRGVLMMSGAAAVLALVGVTSAAPTIININGRTNHILNPVQLFFEAGTYTLDPIGVADGGLYNAISYGAGQGPGRYKSWHWWYWMESPELGVVAINTPQAYLNYEMDAFAAAVSTTFSLSTDADVKFYILDGPGGYAYAGDNIGGISLRVSSGARPIPAPCGVVLASLGAGLVGWLRRRRGV